MSLIRRASLPFVWQGKKYKHSLTPGGFGHRYSAHWNRKTYTELAYLRCMGHVRTPVLVDGEWRCPPPGRLEFTDGSWADFNTGEIHNAGKGDLILAPYMAGYPAYPTKQV